MYEKYKNSYKVTEKELVSLSVYNVGFQRCDSLYQWGPGIRDHYLIHYIISGTFVFVCETFWKNISCCQNPVNLQSR